MIGTWENIFITTDVFLKLLLGKVTCDGEQFAFAIRQGELVIGRMTFVIVKMKYTFDKMLLDNGRLTM
mgnify:CR=1 FL=1